MNSQVLDRIEHPQPIELEQLRDTACEAVREQLPERAAETFNTAVLRKLAYTYYHDWTTDDPEYMLVGEDPGSITDRHTSELSAFDVLEDEPFEQIELYRRFAKRWLAADNTHFTQRFFGLCDEYGLVNTDGAWREYIRDDTFFDDFYMADIVKYRAPSIPTSAVTAAVAAQFLPELVTLSPTLIFAFGGRAWDVLRDQLALTPVTSTTVPVDAGITDVHGELFAAQRLVDTHVLPLGHMSTQVYGAQIPRETYMAELEAGLEQWVATQ